MLTLGLRPTTMGSENRKHNKFFHSSYGNPRAVPSVVMDDSVHCILYTKKKRAFRTQPLTTATSHLTGNLSRQNLEGVLSTERRVLAAKLESRKWSASLDLALDVGEQPISVSYFSHRK